MAPELIEGTAILKEIKRIDFWSLGCILYEFLVGITPFGGKSPKDVFDNIIEYKLAWPVIGYGEDELTPEA